jgi:hypothetical protein
MIMAIETIQTLPAQFQHGGFAYRQIRREGDVAIFSQSKGGVLMAYEVVLIRVRPAHTWPNGKTSPAREGYPGNEEWGVAGWTCLTLERAEKRSADQVRKASGAGSLLYTSPEERSLTPV